MDFVSKSRDSKERSKSPGRRRKFSLGNVRTRSASLESGDRMSGSAHMGSMPLPTVRRGSSVESKKKEPKTFSVTIFVNECEKNKIVDLIHKAKSMISKKVEKVMGKKPKSSISNVDVIHTVLESWMDREQENEKEDDKLVETLIKEQEIQVEGLIKSGQRAPVSVPTLAVEEDEDIDSDDDEDTIEEEPETDIEVKRLTQPRYLRPPDMRRSRTVSEQVSSVRSLSPVDHVPCPFGNRPESELYPPKLRRPSSMYGAGALAAYSRPPSRQVSVSPSVQPSDILGALLNTQIPDIDREDQEEVENIEEEEEEEEEYEEEGPPVRYARPDSFLIPIGGVWRPGDEAEAEPRWSKLPTEEEYRDERRRTEGDARRDPLL